MTNQAGNVNNAGIDFIGSSEIGALSIGELDVVGGGADNNYHECVLGSKAGGSPGLYPWYVACREK